MLLPLGDGLAQERQHLEVRRDKILVVAPAHRPVVPELHLREAAQVAKALHDLRELAIAALGDDRVREGRDPLELVKVLEPAHGLVERAWHRGNGVVGCGIRGRDAHEVLVDASVDQLAAISLVRQPHPMGLDPHVHEPAVARHAREIGKVAAQGHL